MVWNINGKKYDLTKFLDLHPGGKNILQLTENENDLTVAFEVYHSFSNKKYINKILETYEIKEEKQDINELKENNKKYDFTNYNKLVEKIKKIYPNLRSIKSSNFFVIQNITVFLLYAYFFYIGFFSDNSLKIKCLFSFLAGLFYVSLGFNIMHDASHFAISIKQSTNYTLNKLWHGWGLWNDKIWFYHHVLNHHSYTGEIKKDPDLYHLKPFYNKTLSDKKQLFFNNTHPLPFLLTFLPGGYFGQIFSYLVSRNKKKIFQIKIPDKNMYDNYDIFLMCLHP